MALGSLVALQKNPESAYLEATNLILKILDDIIKFPCIPVYRHIDLSNEQVSNRLLSAIGAMECLFELGFQEGDHTLFLPFHSSLDELVEHRNEIARRRNNYLSTRSQISSSGSRQLYIPIGPIRMNPLMNIIFHRYNFVLEYENRELQEAARKCIPLGELEIAAERNMRKIQLTAKLSKKEENVTILDLLMMELVSWFKNSFFTWVDAPNCNNCGGSTKFMENSYTSCGRAEIFKCDHCSGTTPFYRYEDPWKLLETRKGRCGEWAICFTLLCRSLGFDARLICDLTDHMWTEVYCFSDNPRWVHVDPCEGVIDAPLMYECGWGKQLSYIFSFSVDGVQDVTWRYTQIPTEEILLRRKKSGITEAELVATIVNLRQERYKTFSLPKKKYYIHRTLSELTEFLWSKDKELQVTEQEKKGRISGSLAWRLQRSEIGAHSNSFQPYIWRLSESERGANEFIVKYSCNTDRYLKIVGKKETEIKGWGNGLFQNVSIFRKEERDWKMVYLAREEGSAEGRIKFKFDVSNSGLIFDTVSILCKSTVYENGKVDCILCGGEISSKVPSGENVSKFETTALEGLQTFTLEMKLSGGNSWQHAQLFRQPLTGDEQYALEINIKLKKPST